MTRRDEGGQLLLTTPTVSHRLAQHLGVLGGSLGVPLEEEVRMRTPWAAERKEGAARWQLATSPVRALCLHIGRPDCYRVL